MKTNPIINLLHDFKTSSAKADYDQVRFSIYESYFSLLFAMGRNYFDTIEVERVFFDFFEKRITEKYLQHYPINSTVAFEKYLFTAFRNFCYTEKRKLLRKEQLSDNLSIATQTMLPNEQTQQLNVVVKYLLGPLTMDHKTVVILRAIKFSFREIGEIMGISEKAAKCKMSRAKGHLKKRQLTNKTAEFKDFQKLNTLLLLVQDQDVQYFLKLLSTSNKGLGQIFHEIEQTGVDPNNLIARSIGYVKTYYRNAA